MSTSGSCDLFSVPVASFACYKDKVWPPGSDASHLMPSVVLHGSVTCSVLLPSSVIWSLEVSSVDGEGRDAPVGHRVSSSCCVLTQ